MAFGKTDYTKLREKYLSRQASSVDDTKWFKPEVGRYRIRILPPPENHNLWYLDYGVHYGFSNAEGNFETITCPKLTLKKPCPICEFTKGLWKKNTEADIVIARKFGAKKRFISNVVIMNNSMTEVRMWAYGPMVLGQLEEHCVTAKGDVVPIDDPQNGVNMKLIVTQKNTPEGNFPNYQVAPEYPPMPLEDKSVLGKLHDIVTIIQSRVKSHDEIRAILEVGTIGGESDEPAAPAHTAKTAVEEEPAKQSVSADKVTGSDDDEEIIEETSHASAPESGKAPARPSQEELVRRAREALAKRKSS